MRRIAVLVLVVAGLLPGCARSVSPGADAYRALDLQQADACDGVPAPAAGTLRLLSAEETITAAVICVHETEYVAGQGFWDVRSVHELPASELAALPVGLTQPDGGPASGGCTSSLLVVPDFVLTLADGTRVRPGVPGDGCHPLPDAVAAFGDASSLPVRSQQRVTQVASDLQARSNCGSQAKGPVVWADQHAAPAAPPAVPTSGSVSVCRYEGDVSGGDLSRVGIPSAAAVTVAWPTSVAATTTLTCPTLEPGAQPQSSQFLFLLRTPRPPYRPGAAGSDLIAMAEIDGCHRYLSADGGLIGYLSTTQLTALVALADQPGR